METKSLSRKLGKVRHKNSSICLWLFSIKSQFFSITIINARYFNFLGFGDTDKDDSEVMKRNIICYFHELLIGMHVISNAHKLNATTAIVS